MLVVRPRLLGDTLARALRAEGLTVIEWDGAGRFDVAADVDVAIVTDSQNIDVPLVIKLPAPEDHGIGSITRRGLPAEPVRLTDVRSVVANVQVESGGDG